MDLFCNLESKLHRLIMVTAKESECRIKLVQEEDKKLKIYSSYILFEFKVVISAPRNTEVE